MSRSLTRDTARSATTIVKTFKRSNPLMMRKKLEIKDVYFRENEPDRDLLRFELAFDFEEYFIIVAGVIVMLILARKLASWAHRREIKKAYAQRLKKKHS